MTKNKRQHHRVPVDYQVSLYWEDGAGQVFTIRPRVRDASEAGMCVESTLPVEPGTRVFLDVATSHAALEGVVRYCAPSGFFYRLGLELSAESRGLNYTVPEIDYYEVLQLSSNADPETIHRVYRIMAQRFHPDNPESVDPERFILLTEAYQTLSNPEQRARYDLRRSSDRSAPLPLFQSRVFVDDKEGEMNRRLGVLGLLFRQRRRNPGHPSISLLELEQVMAIPREYLEFTLWYLKQKKYVEMDSSAEFSLTAIGVDFVEEHTPSHDLLQRLLGSPAAGGAHAQVQAERFGEVSLQ